MGVPDNDRLAGLSSSLYIFAKTAVNVEICDPTWNIGVRQYFMNRRRSENSTVLGISTISTHKTLESR
jgi:hypothetical protein